jgi:hypothetical protein
MKFKPKKYIVLFVFVLFSCTNERDFEWTEDLQTMIGEDLNGWLRKSPFNGEWNPTEDDKDVISFDNSRQVFPFMGGFKDENSHYRDYFGHSLSKSKVYQVEKIIFKDSQFGESFVYAALTYDGEELFMRPSYSESGSPVFSTDFMSESHDASLSETMISEKNDSYKTTIYWVDSNYQLYLCGFYQKDKLVFQFAFPCTIGNKSKGLEKIKEINLTLGLNIKEWENSIVDDLEINKTPQSFLDDPFVGLYNEGYFSPKVEIKIKNTGFQKWNEKYAKEEGFDYIFTDFQKEYKISFKREVISLAEDKYDRNWERRKPIEIISRDEGRGQLFITDKQEVDGQIILKGETYFKDSSILKIEGSYPGSDSEAQELFSDILSNLKVHKY